MANESSDKASRAIHASPTKDFFVKMITRDISLEDCIFDLLDNSIDGARRAVSHSSTRPLEGFRADITFDDSAFCIEDNCGGIALSDAIDYAFHFGRRHDSPPDSDGGIGLYGIGMKRAIFKIGSSAVVESETETDSFKVEVDVEDWLTHEDWDFHYDDSSRSGTHGTRIEVKKLRQGVSAALGDSVFSDQLIRLVARDYSFFMEKGFKITVRGKEVPSYGYCLKSNEELAPAEDYYEDEGVRVRIIAGLIDDLPDDVPDTLSPKEVERYGWYVVCNDRIVIAADKTDKTIWGDDDYKVWHPQYNGFAGFLFFYAKDQRLLPWTTTKRSLDNSSPLYRRALRRLKAITDQFVSYTQWRKDNLDMARRAEAPRQRVDVYRPAAEDPIARAMKLPSRVAAPDPDPLVNIAYKRRRSEVDEIRSYIGDSSMAYRDVGMHTFDYFREVELGK